MSAINNRDKKISEAIEILQLLGLPKEQLNERTAICLLALLDIDENKNWNDANNPMIGIRAILDFAREKLGKNYAENTRESVRKYSVKQLVSAGILLHNPDKPDRAINSSDNCYQIEESALQLFRKYGENDWNIVITKYLSNMETLVDKYAKVRAMQKIPLNINENNITLSAGDHSQLIKSIITEFGPYFIPGGQLVYVGDTGSKWGFFDQNLLREIGVEIDLHGKMPDVVIYCKRRNWLILVEAVISSGPVDGLRHNELSNLFKNSSAGIVYVTAFPDRGEIMKRFLSVIAWETEIWCASDPTHLIHLNGDRFLGPHN